MKNSHVIALVGEQRAGKGTTAEIFKKIAANQHELTISRHTFSDAVREILQERNIPFGRKTAQDLVMEMINTKSSDALSKIVEKRILNDTSYLIILDGIRLWSDYQMISRFPRYKIVYITAPAEIRYERAIRDNDKIDEKNISFEEFCARENHRLESDIPIIGSHVANHHIFNTGTKVELEEKVLKLYRKIKF